MYFPEIIKTHSDNFQCETNDTYNFSPKQVTFFFKFFREKTLLIINIQYIKITG